jgi:Cellulose biosynthesis protein BcsS
MSRRAYILTGFLLFMATDAHAEGMYLAGGEYGPSSSYAFVGTVLPLPGNKIGSGYAVRLWGDYLTYNYLSLAKTVKASGWGGEASGIYQFSGAWGWGNVSLGARYRDTMLSPDDFNNRARGVHIYGTAQVDGGYNLDASWRIRGVANLTSTVNGYYLQPAIDRAVDGSLRLGVDATLQGDESYHQKSVGANLTFGIGSRSDVGIRVGATISGAKTGPYAGLLFLLSDN